MKRYIGPTTIITPHQQLEHAAILWDGPRLLAVGNANEIPCPPDAEVINATNLIVAPGLIDIQLNGAFGLDFTADPHTIWQVAAQLPRYGVTSFLPTIITSPLENVAVAQQVMATPPAHFRGSAPLGLHLEGPFLHPSKKGAHNPKHLRLPTLEATVNWSPETHVRLVTLAPELPGALATVQQLTAHGVVVSAGHSMATYNEAQQGFEAGVRYGTHLFNAMPTLHHREPGLAGALLYDARPVVGLIPDGLHVHSSLVALAWRLLGNQRLSIVTDAMAALGMPPGEYQLGDHTVTVDETSAHLPDGTLAGSIISMDGTLRNLIAFTGCTLAEALPTMTTTPAKLLGVSAERGQLIAGAMADMVLLTSQHEVAMTIAAGEIVYQRVS